MAGRIGYVTVTFEPVSDAHAHKGILTVVCFSNANNSNHRIVTVLVVELKA